jgi:hypothetical protein
MVAAAAMVAMSVVFQTQRPRRGSTPVSAPSQPPNRMSAGSAKPNTIGTRHQASSRSAGQPRATSGTSWAPPRVKKRMRPRWWRSTTTIVPTSSNRMIARRAAVTRSPMLCHAR